MTSRWNRSPAGRRSVAASDAARARAFAAWQRFDFQLSGAQRAANAVNLAAAPVVALFLGGFGARAALRLRQARR